jgi:hypothetical protein
VVVKNEGPSAATNVCLSVELPENVIGVHWASSRGSRNCRREDRVVMCALGTLQPEQEARVGVGAYGGRPGLYRATAHVRGDQHDPVLANNQDTAVSVVDPSA